MAKSHKLNFAVGSADGLRSNMWKIKTRGNHAYVMWSGLGDTMKISFHEGLLCRDATTKEYANQNGVRREVAHEWHRVPTPPRGQNGGSRVMSIFFPTDYLSKANSLPNRNDITWIDPAPAHAATVIELFFTNETREHTAALTQGFIASLPVGSEGLVVRSGSDQAWENEDLTVPAGLSVDHEYRFLANDPLGPDRPARMCMHRLSHDRQVLIVVERGGYSVPLPEAGLRVPGSRHGTLTRTHVTARSS